MDITELRLREILREELAAFARELSPPSLSEEVAAAHLGGIPVATLARLARERKIGHVVIGRQRIYPLEALQKYVEDHTLQPEANPWGLTDGALRNLQKARTGR